MNTTQPDKRIIEHLAKSQLYRDYERAFGEATGLPLNLTSPDDWQLAHRGRRHENAFCALLAKTNKTCSACLCTQQELAEKSEQGACTVTCFAGLSESCVPVRNGGKIIALLRTGEVATKKPTRAGFARIATQLQSWDAKVDLQELERAYFSSEVMSAQHYDSIVKLLHVFAEHLGLIANVVAIHHEHSESPNIAKARKFIEEHMIDDISLADAARAANMSTFYFCKKFKQATGFSFTEYLSRVRVEAAKRLLLNPQARVSEVAFEVGFQSITHFNRVFREIVGQSPTEYRETLRYAA